MIANGVGSVVPTGDNSSLGVEIIATTMMAMSVAVTVYLLAGLQYLVAQIVGISRRSRGLCFTCAYDLHGNLSGVCPECGRRV